MSGDAFWPTFDRGTYASAEMSCPHCGYVIDSHDSFDGHPPRAGDVSLCLRCGKPAVYELRAVGRFRLRRPFVDELVDIMASPKYQALQATWRTAFGPGGPNDSQD